MRHIKKEEAFQEYGLRYVPSLEDLNFDVAGSRSRNPDEVLVQNIERLLQSRFDGVIKMREDLGPVTEEFHYRDLEDIRSRAEKEQRAYYEETLVQLGDLMTTPDNMKMLNAAAESTQPEHKRLRSAFEKAYEKMTGIDAFLSSRAEFRIDIQPLKPVLTFPDVILKQGDAVYVVEDDGKALPRLVETEVGKRDFHGSFWHNKPDFAASYEIRTGAVPAPKGEDTFYASDSTDEKTPAGGVAWGKNKLVFNSKASATAHIGEVLAARETALKKQLQEIRAQRRKIAPPKPSRSSNKKT